MEIKIGVKYVIQVSTSEVLTFIGIITSQDETFITFTDIKDNSYTFNKKFVVSLTPYKNDYRNGNNHNKKEGNGDDNKNI
jgi:hypothetical protein